MPDPNPAFTWAADETDRVPIGVAEFTHIARSSMITAEQTEKMPRALNAVITAMANVRRSALTAAPPPEDGEPT